MTENDISVTKNNSAKANSGMEDLSHWFNARIAKTLNAKTQRRQGARGS